MPKIKKINSSEMNDNSLVRVNWAVLCKDASVDQRSNLVSLQTVIEEITLTKNAELDKALSKDEKIQIGAEFSLVVQLDRLNPEDQQFYSSFLEINVVDPDGIELGKTSIPLEIQKDKRRFRVIIRFNNFIITKAGDYNFVIMLRTKDNTSFYEGTRVPLEIKIK
jgi:hypothetical protein